LIFYEKKEELGLQDEAISVVDFLRKERGVTG
jgi:hypothetical protein